MPPDDEQQLSLLDVLSVEAVLLKVLEHLTFHSTIALGCCCKRLHASTLSDTHVWREFFMRAYPLLPREPSQLPSNSRTTEQREGICAAKFTEPQAAGTCGGALAAAHMHAHAPNFSVPPNATHKDFSYLVTSPIARHLSNCATMHALLATLTFRAVFVEWVPPLISAPHPFTVMGGWRCAVELELEDDLGGAARPLDSLTQLPWPILGPQWRREPVLRQLQLPRAQQTRHATDGFPWIYRSVCPCYLYRSIRCIGKLLRWGHANHASGLAAGP